jgi:predicted nucleic acid-binding protein
MSFWYALSDRSDRWHGDAHQLRTSAGRLVTSNHVPGETWTMLRSRRIREALAFDAGFTAAGFVEVRT